MSTPSPYNPGFGIDPPYLAGRDEALDVMITGLTTGPRSRYFGAAVFGERGVGKTVFLNALEDKASGSLQWCVVREQASRGDNVAPLLVDRVKNATSKWRRVQQAWKRLEKEFSVGANVGVVTATAKVSSRPQTKTAPRVLEELLLVAGREAASKKIGLLITCDEAHEIGIVELSALGRVMQLLVKREKLPVAIVFSGLPELRGHFRQAGTYLERHESMTLENLSPEAARLALVQPAADLGVTFDPAALDTLVAAFSGYPYAVQLVGEEAWNAAKGARRITLGHANKAIEVASRRLSDLYAERWQNLPPRERQYLVAVAKLGPGPVSVGDVADALGSTVHSLSPRRDTLIKQRLLHRTAKGELQLALPPMRLWILQQKD